MRTVEADYYTDANLAVTFKVLDMLSGEAARAPRNYGEVMVAAQATIYKKIKLHTHENIGWGKIHLPEQELHTTAYWLCVPPLVADKMAARGKAALQAGLVGLGNVLSPDGPALPDVRPPRPGRGAAGEEPLYRAEHNILVRVQPQEA